MTTVRNKSLKTHMVISTSTETDQTTGDSIERPEGIIIEENKFEITLDTLILSDFILKKIFDSYGSCVGVNLRWSFFGNEERSITEEVKGNEVIIGKLYTYYFPSDSLVECFANEIIRFQVFGVFEKRKEKYIGCCDLKLHDCIDNVNMRVRKYLDLVDLVAGKCTKRNINRIGNLFVKYSLCFPTLQNKDDAGKQFPLVHISSTTGEGNPQNTNQLKHIKKSKSVQKIFKKVSEYMLPSLKVKNDDSQNFVQEGLTNNSAFFNQLALELQVVITISVNFLKLNEEFGHTLKENKTYYVEYSFLRHDGLETLSLPLTKNYSIIYNSKATFKIDARESLKECRIISRMINKDHCLRFYVVEEPVVYPPEIPVCSELGYADVHMHELAHGIHRRKGHKLLTMTLPHDHIGFLSVAVTGLDHFLSKCH